MRKISAWIVGHRNITLTAILLVTVFFGFEIKKMVIRTQLEDLFPKSHPFIKVHEKYKDQLGNPFKVFMMLQVKDGDIYTKETLEKVIRITDGLDEIPGVNHNHIYSIASRKLRKIKTTKEGVVTTEYLMQEVPESMEEFRKTVRTTPGVYGVWVSRDERSVLFTASFIERLMDYNTIFKQVHKLIDQESDARHTVYAAGEPILQGWVNKFQKEVYFIFGVTFLGFILLLFVYFRNLLGVIVHIPPIILGIIWFLGFAGFLGFNVEPLTLVIPVLIVARSLSHSVQYTERYFEIYHEGGEKDVDGACIKALNYIFPPGVLGIVADAIGLLVIAVAPIPMMQKLAVLCGFWAFSIIFTGMLFTPIFISYSASWHPKNIAKVVEMEKGIVQRSLAWIARLGYGKRGKVSFAVCVIVAIITGWFAYKVNIGDIHPGSPLLWEDSEFNVAVGQMNRNFPGTEELYVIVEGEGNMPIESPGFLRILDSFQRYMEASPLVGRTFSIADYLPQMYKSIYDGHPKFDTLPLDRVQAHQLLHRLTASSAPGDFDLYMARDGQYANVIVWYKDHMGDTLRSAIARVKAFIQDQKEVLAREKCSIQLASGNIGVLAAINETVEASQLLNFLMVTGIVFLLCALTYQSFAAATILMIPLNLTNIITLSIMYWLGIGLNINTLPILSVGVGVGIDYGIYLLSRICEEYQMAGGQYSSEVASRAVKTTGKAIFFTGSTMIVGVIFWYFLSSMKFQAEMGLLLALIMSINVVTALVMIPTLVNFFRPKFLGRVKLLVQH